MFASAFSGVMRRGLRAVPLRFVAALPAADAGLRGDAPVPALDLRGAVLEFEVALRAAALAVVAVLRVAVPAFAGDLRTALAFAGVRGAAPAFVVDLRAAADFESAPARVRVAELRPVAFARVVAAAAVDFLVADFFAAAAFDVVRFAVADFDLAAGFAAPALRVAAVFVTFLRVAGSCADLSAAARRRVPDALARVAAERVVARLRAAEERFVAIVGTPVSDRTSRFRAYARWMNPPQTGSVRDPVVTRV